MPASAANRVFPDCRGADIRVRRACRTRPVAPHGKADRVSRRRGERGAPWEPRPGRPDAAGTRGRLLDGRLPTGCLETRGDPGQAEGCHPGIIQRARLRQAVRPPERRGGARQCVPGRRAQQGAASQHVRARHAVTLSDIDITERAHCRRFARLIALWRLFFEGRRSGFLASGHNGWRLAVWLAGAATAPGPWRGSRRGWCPVQANGCHPVTAVRRLPGRGPGA